MKLLDTIGKLFTKSITLRIPVESIDGQLVEGLNALVSNNKESTDCIIVADDEDVDNDLDLVLVSSKSKCIL